MSDLHYLSLMEASRLVRRRELTSVELTQAVLDRIDGTDLRAYARVQPEAALQYAKQADAELAEGRIRGRLHGIPIGLKDLCATPDGPTRVGGIAITDWRPDGEATVARRLREAGGVLVGKLQTTEGAYAVHHPDVAPPINPWNRDYWTGVSSSGSGSGTAGGLCYASLGTDTGGSIRFPSYCCGAVGIKPTWGRVSRHDVFALSDSLDHVGPICRTVEDASAVLAIIAGPDPLDSTSIEAPVPDYVAELERGVRGLRIGIDERYCSDEVDPDVARLIFRAAEILRDAGAEICSVRMPDSSEAVEQWGILCAAEAALAHEGYFPERKDQYGPGLADLLEAGRRATALDYARAHNARIRYAGASNALFQQVDMVLSPSSYTKTPTLEEIASLLEGDNVGRLIEFTAPADLSGSPAICLPGGFDDAGAPYGFQIVGRHLSEDLLCRAGYAYQEATDWKHRHP